MATEVSDEQLVERARSEDKEAFVTLYQRYLNKVYARVKNRVPLRDVEDVTQDIFIAVVRSLKHFEQRSLFSTWLYTIVNRQIADYYRKHYRTSEAHTISFEEHEGLDLPFEVENQDEFVVIQQALGELPTNYQAIIHLRISEGLPFAEIAQRQGQTLEATKSLYRRAIQALSSKVE
jgi:RNA polymerase sigma-70 factor (ECF subfamily)